MNRFLARLTHHNTHKESGAMNKWGVGLTLLLASASV
ncbi:sulfate transporter subunit, partial [Klebsiella pneumoniae]